MLQIHIYGLDRVERSEVVEFLNVKGINVFTLMDFNIQQLEEELANEFNFSLVSIATKGNSLLISIKEELPDMKDSFVPIVADYNMIVKSIDVYAGTPCVNVGEIVYKGDTLVLLTNNYDKKMVNFIGMSYKDANSILKLMGVKHKLDGYGYVYEQNIEKDKKIDKEVVLKLKSKYE